MNSIKLLILLIVLSQTINAEGIPAVPIPHLNSSVTTLCKGQINSIPITITASNTSLDNVALSLVYAVKNGSYSGNGTIYFGDIGSYSSRTETMPIYISQYSPSPLSVEFYVNYVFGYEPANFQAMVVQSLNFSTTTACPSTTTLNTTQTTTVPTSIMGTTTPSSTAPTTVQATTTQNTTVSTISSITTIPPASNSQPNILQQIWNSITSFFSHL